MKKMLVLMIVALNIWSVNVQSQTVSPGPRVSVVIDKLNNLISAYGSSVYTALFSIDELKPGAILQIDRLATEYSGNWESPARLAGSLSNEEQEILINGISNQLATDYKNTERLIQRIRNWCLAELQFNFLADKLEFKRKDLLEAVGRIPEARSTIANYMKEIAPEENTSDEIICEMKYYNTLNALSAVSFKAQLAFYSKLYGQLSLICQR